MGQFSMCTNLPGVPDGVNVHSPLEVDTKLTELDAKYYLYIHLRPSATQYATFLAQCLLFHA